MTLLIHADPGARSGFLAAWLTDKLTKPSFDTGIELLPGYTKIHRLDDPARIIEFNGIKIRIRPTIESIDLLSFLFLRKNVYTQIPNFTRNEYSLETMTKITEFAKEIFQWDSELDYSLYDYVLDFSSTYDTGFMIGLYRNICGREPSLDMITMLEQSNKLNSAVLDKNHACSIVKLCLQREQELNLDERHRFWSVVDTYNTTPVPMLYDTIYRCINPKNYGILL